MAAINVIKAARVFGDPSTLSQFASSNQKTISEGRKGRRLIGARACIVRYPRRGKRDGLGSSGNMAKLGSASASARAYDGLAIRRFR